MLKLCPSCHAFQDSTKKDCPNCDYDLSNVEIHIPKKEMRSRRRVRIYLVIAFVFLLAPTFYAILVLGEAADIKRFPSQKKMELLSLDQYKNLGIETVEEFDSFWDGILKIRKLIWLKVFTTISILFGLIFFLKWIYWASVTYISLVLLNFVVRDFSILFVIGQPIEILFPHKALEIPVLIFLLIYLLRKKTRQHYLQPKIDDLT